MSCMFKDCKNLKILDLRAFDFGKINVWPNIITLNSIFENMGFNYNAQNQAVVYIPKIYNGNTWQQNKMKDYVSSLNIGTDTEKVKYQEMDLVLPDE